jgi:hypothetical protein
VKASNKPSKTGAVRIAKLTVPMRIVVVSPPKGVMFALQRGRDALEAMTVSTGDDLRFDFTILVDRDAQGLIRFTGEFAQGPKGGKFVYVNSGTLAGQSGSCWTRRAKVGLETLTWADATRVAAEPGAFFQSRFAGVGRDGGPACATVPLLDKGWVVSRSV